MESISKIFDDIVKNKYEVVVWNTNEGRTIKAEIHLESAVAGRINKLFFTLAAGDAEIIGEMITGSGILNFFVPHKGLFFSSSIAKLAEKRLEMEWPNETDFKDRRLKDRVDAFSVAVMIDIGTKKFTKNAFDLSSGGVSLVFMRSENTKSIVKGETYPLTIKYGKDVLSLTGQVVDMKKITPYQHDTIPYGGERVAFQFVDLKNEERVAIVKIIDALR